MNDDTINRAIDMVAAGAGKLEQAVRDMAPHVWDAEVSYWRTRGLLMMGATAVCGLLCWLLASKALRAAKSDRFAEGEVFDFAIAATIIGIMGIVGLGMGGFDGLFAAAFAPEMYAIRDLLAILK